MPQFVLYILRQDLNRQQPAYWDEIDRCFANSKAEAIDRFTITNPFVKSEQWRGTWKVRKV